MTTIPKSAVEVDGRHYLRDAKGNLVPHDNVRPVDLLMDELVQTQVEHAKNLSAEIGRFLVYSEAEIAEFDALLAQEYNVARPEKTKGNRTLTSYDGLRQVRIKVQDRETFGPELQQAKALLDEMIRDRAEGADGLLVALVNQAFKVDKEGMVDRASLTAIRRLQIDDPRWPDLCRAIDESRRIIGAKRYITFHERASTEERFEMVPLDHAAIQPGPEVFEADSPRRELEKCREAAGTALEKLSVALTLMEDGAMVSAAHAIAMAAEALGGDLSAEVTEYEAYVAEIRARMAIDHPRTVPTNEEA